MRKPTNNPVTQTAAQHGYPATDYSYQPDEWVYAPENGVVTDVTLNAGDCGKRVQFKGDITGATYYMCHFQDVGVAVGKRLTEGQRIGIMGDTGLGTGRHLHLVIYVNGARVPDPDVWLKSKITTVGGKKMVTARGLNIITRFYVGRDPSATEVTKYVGKVDFDTTAAAFSGSAEYNAQVTALKGSSKGIKAAIMNHLPSRLRA